MNFYRFSPQNGRFLADFSREKFVTFWKTAKKPVQNGIDNRKTRSWSRPALPR